MNNAKLRFDPNRTPILQPRSAENAYYVNTRWQRGAEQVQLKYLKREADALGETITIDVKARTVVDEKSGDSIRQALAALTDPWLTLPAGASSVSVKADDEGAEQEDHVMEFRSTWQA